MISVCSIDDIPEGEAFRFNADVPIAVFNTGDALYAIDDTCTHQDASLADGWVEDGCVECPLHAACFDLSTGMPSGPPAKKAVRTHQVIVSDRTVYVAINETPAELPVGEEIGVA
ncbi:MULTISPECIES: bifunctional 3-phenylpropionate/cinnamic acid dioxygenase ferredoxin subunit [Sciscionella]|uniref:bifunctional 3-phenylpropionate/cinnamic acid dioxygenase ferredoxin subunit n=1 Tax=Sciscionella TaxID=596495 RepID=UPI00036DB02F|nr:MULTISPECIES: bifunctional 3-phenylpropionate/cinnamic acid dioxygenase ferredoxin subunit [Sciscionella]